MGKTFMPKIRTERELKRVQLEGLQKTVNHTYKNSEFYQKRLDETGVQPKHVKTLKDISKLPFSTAKDLRRDTPFLCARHLLKRFDTGFGYKIMHRLLGVVSERLQAARLQVLDMYSPIAKRAGA